MPIAARESFILIEMILVIVESMDSQKVSGFTGTSFVLEEMFWRGHSYVYIPGIAILLI